MENSCNERQDEACSAAAAESYVTERRSAKYTTHTHTEYTHAASNRLKRWKDVSTLPDSPADRLITDRWGTSRCVHFSVTLSGGQSRLSWPVEETVAFYSKTQTPWERSVILQSVTWWGSLSSFSDLMFIKMFSLQPFYNREEQKIMKWRSWKHRTLDGRLCEWNRICRPWSQSGGRSVCYIFLSRSHTQS